MPLTSAGPIESQRVPVGDSLSEYLREIAQHPLLTPEEEIHLAQQARAARDAERALSTDLEVSPLRRADLERALEAGRRARQRLIESNLRLVVSIARRYRGHGLSLLDLIQEGNIGLQVGVDRFDWRKGFRLSTYVYWWIRQGMTRALANDARIIRLPVHVGEQMRLAAQAEQRLAGELGREPTLAEVARQVGLEPERLRMLRLMAAEPVSLDIPLDTDGELTRVDSVPDQAATPELQTAQSSDNLEAPVAAALETLPDREREVLRLRYGLGRTDSRSLAEIGARLGVTRERARQLESQALRRLRSDSGLRSALLDLAGG